MRLLQKYTYIECLRRRIDYKIIKVKEISRKDGELFNDVVFEVLRRRYLVISHSFNVISTIRDMKIDT